MSFFNTITVFRLQPALLTREKQLEAWSDLVLDYCQFHKIYTLVISDISNTELFCNSTLNRRLSSEGVRAVFDFLEQKSLFFTRLKNRLREVYNFFLEHVDWLDSSKNRCHIYWRRPEEWASLIYNWAVSNAQLDIPLTLHELTRGVDTTRECMTSKYLFLLPLSFKKRFPNHFSWNISK